MAHLLEIDPKEEIELEKQPGMQSTGWICLCNVKGGNVAYKVKTTKPEFYIVRPNQGILTPGKTEKVQITLKVLPKELTELSHRFCIVQSKTDLKAGDEDQLTAFWLKSNLAITQKVLKTRLIERQQGPVDLTPPAAAVPKRVPRRARALEAPEKPQYRELQRTVQTQNSELASLTKQVEELRLTMRRKDEEEALAAVVPKQGWSAVYLLTAILLGLISGLVLLR